MARLLPAPASSRLAAPLPRLRLGFKGETCLLPCRILDPRILEFHSPRMANVYSPPPPPPLLPPLRHDYQLLRSLDATIRRIQLHGNSNLLGCALELLPLLGYLNFEYSDAQFVSEYSNEFE